MDHSLFISDLHLCDSRPHITESFIHFLNTTASNAQALYILGDFFEYWAGDDVIVAGEYDTIIKALKKLSHQNISVFLMHGNRDFLLGKAFSETTGIKILSDPTLIRLYDKEVLLSHGDALCTDDVAYQQFRSIVRTEHWQTQFLNKPLDERLAYIEQARSKSESEKSIKSMEIMDVNSLAVENLLAKYDYPSIFIHGHTHRPMKHIYNLNGHGCERWVLGDWYEQGSYLRLDQNGCHAQTL